jgi:hypothetical protein
MAVKYTMHPLLDLSSRPIIAHRGASGAAPENTMAAFELAASQGQTPSSWTFGSRPMACP